MNDDQKIDMADFQILIAHIGITSEDEAYNPKYDIDGNGIIDIEDGKKLLTTWGLNSIHE